MTTLEFFSMSRPRRSAKPLTDAKEKECIEKLRLNANYFQNNFVKASWIPSDQLTDLRNWHSPMIREWTYNGHTRAGQPVGLNQCLPKRYSFVDVARKSKASSSLPPSFHKMPDMSPEHIKSQSHINKELKELVKTAEKFMTERPITQTAVQHAVSGLNKVVSGDSSMRKMGKHKHMGLKRTRSRHGEYGIPLNM